MNSEHFEGSWAHFKTRVKEQWSKLTDDDLDHIDGKRDHLLGKLQERHGMSRDEAETQFSNWHEKNPTNFFERY